LLVIGCPHGICPSCGRRTHETRHLDSSPAGDNCAKLPLVPSGDKAYARKHEPAPPRPRSMLWCMMSQKCESQPLDATIVDMQQHVMREHGVTPDDLRHVSRRVFDLAGKYVVYRIDSFREKYPHAWPRQLDRLPLLIEWMLADGRAMMACLRLPPDIAERVQREVPDI
jgi:hypothetical protein